MRENRLKTILAISISAVIVLAALTIAFYPRVMLTVQEWKYKLSGDPVEFIMLCYMSVEAGDGDRMYRYLPEALAIEDFDGNFERSGLGELSNEYGNPYDADEIYTMFLAGELFSTVYTQRYDEFTAMLPTRFEELMQHSFGNAWCYTLIARTDRITQEGYEIIIQSLEGICPERPEVNWGSLETIRRFIEIKSLAGFAWLHWGDEETFERIDREIADINNEVYRLDPKDRVATTSP